MNTRSPRPSAARSADTPRTPWGWALTGSLLGLVVALVAWAPARWLAGAVEQAAGGYLRLADARGTVWNGNARLALAGGAGSSDAAALPGRIGWRIAPRWNGVGLVLDAGCCTAAPLAATLRPRWRGIAIDLADNRTQWPAELLRGLGTPFNTLELTGDLAVSTRGLAVDVAAGRARVTGNAELVAAGLASRVSPLRPLGSYRLALTSPGAAGDAPALQLATLDGALLLDGTGRWVGNRLRFDGSASARPGAEAALANLLNIIGRRQGARSLITIG